MATSDTQTVDKGVSQPSALQAAAATACTGNLNALIHRSPAILFCCLSTVDGRLVARAGRQDEQASQRIAALAASFLALSETFAKESHSGRCTHTTISAEFGTIVAVRVPSKNRIFALSIGADRSDNLASILRQTLDTAEALSAHIS